MRYHVSVLIERSIMCTVFYAANDRAQEKKIKRSFIIKTSEVTKWHVACTASKSRCLLHGHHQLPFHHQMLHRFQHHLWEYSRLLCRNHFQLACKIHVILNGNLTCLKVHLLFLTACSAL